MRFARSEKAGNPDAVCSVVVDVSIQKALQTFLDLVGQDVLLDFELEARFIIGLDDALYGPVNGFAEEFSQGHGRILVLDFVGVNVEGSVVFVVMEQAEQVQRCAVLQGLGVGPWKEHHRRLVLGRALQVVQNRVGADVGEDFSDSGKKHHLKVLSLHALGDSRGKNRLDIEDALQFILEFGLGHGVFLGNIPFQILVLFEDLKGKVIQIDVQNLESGLPQLVDELFAQSLHVGGLLGMEGANEKGNLVSKATFVHESFTGYDLEKMVSSFMELHLAVILEFHFHPGTSDSKTGKMAISSGFPARITWTILGLRRTGLIVLPSTNSASLSILKRTCLSFF